MRLQIEFSRGQDFQRFVNGLLGLEEANWIVHGVFIEYHPLWRRILDASRSWGIYPSAKDHWFPWELITANERELPRHGPYDPKSASSSILDVWKMISERYLGKTSEPIIVRVYVLPTTAATVTLRRIIEDYARQQPFFVSVVDAPMAVAAANIEGGTDVTATRQGTLGGFLKDQKGEIWGLTCAHVAQQRKTAVTFNDVNGAVVNAAATVGETNFSDLPVVTKHGRCNPYRIGVPGAGGVPADIALLKLNASHAGLDSIRQIGKVDRRYDRSDLDSGYIVTMFGARSGLYDWEIGGYGYSCKIDTGQSNDTYWCMGDVFDFSAPAAPSSWLPGRLQQAFSHQPLEGDSGAWLCYHHSGTGPSKLYGYFGSMIGVRGALGIASFAQGVVEWVGSEWSLQLTVL